MAHPFSDSLPSLRSSVCSDYTAPGDTDMTPSQRAQVRFMIVMENVFKLIGLIAMTAAAAACITLYMVQGAQAQSTAIIQAETNASNKVHGEEIDRRLDKIEMKQADADKIVAALDSKVTGVYAFGGGVSTILVILQVFSILSPLKNRAIVP